MAIQILPIDRWTEAVGLLRRSQVVAIPTDTVYGIAAMPLDGSAIDAIYAAKDRPNEKALPMLVSGTDEAERIAVLNDQIRLLCRRFWPGPLTIVAPESPTFASPAAADNRTIGLRMPALKLTLEIIAAAGGVLAVTSANRSGEAPATSVNEVLQQLEGRIAAVVDGGRSPLGTPSTVVSLRGDRVTIVREGAIAAGEIDRVLAG
jgi:L-threonylcarbamoyladenylate synthase